MVLSILIEKMSLVGKSVKELDGNFFEGKIRFQILKIKFIPS